MHDHDYTSLSRARFPRLISRVLFFFLPPSNLFCYGARKIQNQSDSVFTHSEKDSSSTFFFPVLLGFPLLTFVTIVVYFESPYHHLPRNLTGKIFFWCPIVSFCVCEYFFWILATMFPWSINPWIYPLFPLPSMTDAKRNSTPRWKKVSLGPDSSEMASYMICILIGWPRHVKTCLSSFWRKMW